MSDTVCSRCWGPWHPAGTPCVTQTLTDFLLARIADDEAEVAEWPTDGTWGAHPLGGLWMDTTGRPIYAPRDRVLAECEAKRKIVAERLFHDRDPDYELTILGARVLGALALPYSDHPDYRDEWRP